MRTFVLSDIHGNNELFRKSLEAVGLTKEDRLIVVGDVINKGLDSKGVLDTIFELKEQRFDVKCLMGNHEQLFLNAFEDQANKDDWLYNGGFNALDSFGVSAIEEIPKEYVQLIKTFDLIHETQGFVLAHAAVNMKIPDPYSDTETILWSRVPRKFLEESWLQGRTLIHGHTPHHREQIQSAVSNRENVICIDNGTYFKNRANYGAQCIFQLETFSVRFIE